MTSLITIFRNSIYFALFIAQIIRASTGKDCTDPLSCYLASLEFTLPQICESTALGSLCVTLDCTGLFISRIPSSYISPTTLYVGARGLGTQCETYFDWIGSTDLLQATISNTDIDMNVYLQKDGIYANAASLSSCEVSSIDVELSFNIPMPNAITTMLENDIKNAVKAYTCTQINQLLSVNVTNALNNEINPRLAEIGASTADPLPTQYNADPHFLDWNTSKIATLHHILDNVDGLSNLGDFVSCMMDSRQSDAAKVKKADKSEVKILNTMSSKAPLMTEVAVGEEVQGHPDLPLPSMDVKNGALSVSLPPIPIPLPNLDAHLTIDSLTIAGLDTITTMEIVEPLGPEVSKVTLRSEVALQHSLVNVSATLHIKDSSSMPPKTYAQTTIIVLEVSDLTFLMDLVAAVDEHLLDSYHLDQLSADMQGGCWFAVLTQLSLADFTLDMVVNQVSVHQTAGGDAGQLERDIATLLDSAFQLLFAPEGFQALVTQTIKGYVQGPMRQDINSRLSSWLAEGQSAPCLSHYPFDDYNEYIQWPSSPVINLVNNLLNERFGYEGINRLMTCATDGTGKAVINTDMVTITLGGLNSFYGFELLAPMAPASKIYDLETYLALGACPSPSECNSLYIAIQGNAGLYNAMVPALGTDLAAALDSVSLKMTFDNLELYMDGLLKVDMNVLRELQHGQLDTKGCMASSMTNLSFVNMTLETSHATLYYDDGVQSRNISMFINALLGFLTKQEHIDAHNAAINDKLVLAEPTCANDGVVPEDNTIGQGDTSGNNGQNWQWQMVLLSIGCSLALIGLVWAYNYWGVVRPFYLCFQAGKRGESEEVDKFWNRWQLQHSLLLHKDVPVWLRVAVPLAIAATVALFINSNLTPDAVSVMVAIVTKGQTYDMGSIFDFGLGNTVTDMWNAKVYTLAILIAFFSGAWPYVKLICMMAAWVLPPTVMSIERRETVLIVLDVLGKWSLIDFFVMVLMLCAFYFQLVIVPDGMTVDVTVKPKWGFYGFLLATMMSLGLGHAILACHRLITEPKILDLPDEFDPKESLASAVYEVDIIEAVPEDEQQLQQGMETAHGEAIHNPLDTPTPVDISRAVNSSRRVSPQKLLVRVTGAGQAAIVASMVGTAVCLIFGTFLLTMGFEFKGLVGLMLKSDATINYSFVSIGQVLPEHSGVPNDFAVRWMQASYFLFGLAMPLALLVSLTILWVVPLTLRYQRGLFVLSEVLNAWSTLDVFCVAIAASLLEIQQFAAFIVGDSCDAINQKLEMYMDDILDGDDKCFDVIAFLKDYSWVIFLAAGLLLLTAIPTLQCCHHVVKQRLALCIRVVNAASQQGISAMDPTHKDKERDLTAPLLPPNPSDSHNEHSAAIKPRRWKWLRYLPTYNQTLRATLALFARLGLVTLETVDAALFHSVSCASYMDDLAAKNATAHAPSVAVTNSGSDRSDSSEKRSSPRDALFV